MATITPEELNCGEKPGVYPGQWCEGWYASWATIGHICLVASGQRRALLVDLALVSEPRFCFRWPCRNKQSPLYPGCCWLCLTQPPWGGAVG